MRKRKRSSNNNGDFGLPLLPPPLLVLLLLPASAAVAAAAAAAAPAAACILDWHAAPTTEVELLVAFSGEGGGGGDPDPMLTRRFIAERDYVIRVRSLNAKTGIVRFALGLLPHRGGGSRDVGRLLTEPGQRDRRHPNCNAFYCDISCLPRREIRFAWSAQSADGAACVEVRALVTLEYDDKNWLRASAFLCRAPAPGAQVRLFPAAPCCACGSANYLMRFHGAWEPPGAAAAAAPAAAEETEAAEEQQQKQQPQQHQQLSWSELLGTTHDDTYALWELGGYPSGGVQKLCESGWSGTLEDEIKHFGASSVLTVIKARDLPMIPRSEQPLLQQPHQQPQHHQQRSAIFTVNATHHLVTFLSRPVPTPGWCVGLSLLDLCRPNCTWAESVTAQLRLWDAGTDAGRRFSAAAADAAAGGADAPGGGQRPPKPSDPRIAYLEEGTAATAGEAATVSLQRIAPRRTAAAEAADAAGGGCGGAGGRL